MLENILDKSELEKIRQAVSAAKNIVMISHRSPDADAVGSNLAIKKALTKLGKNVVSACIDIVPDNLKFLKGSDSFVQKFDPSQFDLLISGDCGSREQVQFFPEIKFVKENKIPFINIDHHASNDNFGSINIVETRYAATCEIAYYIFDYLGYEIDSDIATFLLTGLYYDTGSFMHSNTSPSNLSIAGELLNKGADFEIIIKNLYKTNTLEQLKTWGLIWSRARINDKDIVISAVTKDDLDNLHSKREYVGGAIDYLNCVKDTKFSMLLNDDGKSIKASVRTQRDDVDLCMLSSIFGGGGHKKASGFSIPGKIHKDVEVSFRIGV